MVSSNERFYAHVPKKAKQNFLKLARAHLSKKNREQDEGGGRKQSSTDLSRLRLVRKYGLGAGFLKTANKTANTVFISMVWGDRYSQYVNAHCAHMDKILVDS